MPRNRLWWRRWRQLRNTTAITRQAKNTIILHHLVNVGVFPSKVYVQLFSIISFLTRKLTPFIQRSFVENDNLPLSQTEFYKIFH